MRRLPPYMIVAVCGILFLSAGMVIITADSADPSAQPTPTVEISTPTEVVVPTVVILPTDIPAPVQAVVQPTVEIPTEMEQPTVIAPTEVVQPVVVPTEVIQPLVAPTKVVQSVQPTVVVEQPQVQPAGLGDAQVQAQPTVVIPASLVPTDAGVVVAPVIEQPNAPLGTLPPPSNISPTAENPVVIPTVVMPTGAALMQITGQIGAPLRADYSGIVVMLTLPDGSALQTITDSAGNFTFSNLVAGAYRVDAAVSGYLSSQTNFTVTVGQNLVLPPATLVGGDTNLDNKIDLTDAALIAANFDSASIVAGADLNYDGIVDIRDLTAIGAYFGLVGPTQWKS